MWRNWTRTLITFLSIGTPISWHLIRIGCCWGRARTKIHPIITSTPILSIFWNTKLLPRRGPCIRPSIISGEWSISTRCKQSSCYARGWRKIKLNAISIGLPNKDSLSMPEIMKLNYLVSKLRENTLKSGSS